jgi:hypothetical protein
MMTSCHGAKQSGGNDNFECVVDLKDGPHGLREEELTDCKVQVKDLYIYIFIKNSLEGFFRWIYVVL